MPTAADATFTHCPKCGVKLEDAPGIGQFCPNRECDVADGVLVADGLAAPVVIRRDPAEMDAAAALLRSMGWTVTAPASATHDGLQGDERDMLVDVARALRCGWTCYQVESVAMRKLAARGLVEPHPDYAEGAGLPAWRITDAGMARVAREIGI